MNSCGVHIVEVIDRQHCPEFKVQDKAIVREIVSPRNTSAENQSLAEITIPPGESIFEHYHVKTEEVYYLLEGRGEMHIDGEVQEVRAGQAVVILPGQRHKITNIGETDLVMLVTCAPAYTDEDQILV